MGVPQTEQQLWGGETPKAIGNFPISSAGVPVPVVRWLGRIQGAPARVNADRTHLMDAVPVTLGQEFAGYAAQVRLGARRIRNALPQVAQLPLGGTATGTGLNTHPEFAERVRAQLREQTGVEAAAPEDP